MREKRTGRYITLTNDEWAKLEELARDLSTTNTRGKNARLPTYMELLRQITQGKIKLVMIMPYQHQDKLQQIDQALAQAKRKEDDQTTYEQLSIL